MEELVVRVLVADNPWLESLAGGAVGTGEKGDLSDWYNKFVPENYLERTIRPEPNHRAMLVVGPRQVGESTLIWKHFSQGGKVPNPVLFLNCEEPDSGVMQERHYSNRMKERNGRTKEWLNKGMAEQRNG